jgi:hypothetical protein
MNKRENLKYQVLAAQCGFAFEILFTIFWGWCGHNLPPASPNLSAPDLAAHFALHHNAILLGNSMAALVAVLWIPWTAQLTVVMWRIEGSSPVLTIVQVIGGALTAWVLMFCPAIWATAAFRPEGDPNLVQSLNDLGFILFNITYAVTSVQAIAAGLVGLADKSTRPVFPLGELVGDIRGPELYSAHRDALLQDRSAGLGRRSFLLGFVRYLSYLDFLDGRVHGQRCHQTLARRARSRDAASAQDG